MHQTPEFIIPRSITPRLSPQALLQPKKFAFPLIVPKPRKNIRVNEQRSAILDLLKKIEKTPREFLEQVRPIIFNKQKRVSFLRLSSEAKREKIQDKQTFSFRKPRLSSMSPKLNGQNYQQKRKRVKTMQQQAKRFLMSNQTITFYPKTRN